MIINNDKQMLKHEMNKMDLNLPITTHSCELSEVNFSVGRGLLTEWNTNHWNSRDVFLKGELIFYFLVRFVLQYNMALLTSHILIVVISLYIPYSNQ